MRGVRKYEWLAPRFANNVARMNKLHGVATRSAYGTLLMAAVVAVACSSGSASSSSDGGLAQGYTSCDGVTCSPGQYCNVNLCAPGCTSVANCAEHETCSKQTGDTTGTCVGGSSSGTTCQRMPAFDASCAGARLPGEAYKCPTSAAAPKPSCVAAPDQTTYPGGWCC